MTSPEAALAMTNLGIAYGEVGDAKQMQQLLELALFIQEREYGLHHRLVASTLANLGNAYGQASFWKLG